MRNMKKAFLFCAVLATSSLFDPTAAMATCPAINGTVAVVNGPCPVATPETPACGSGGDWTGIEYEYADYKSGDVIATLVTVNNNETTEIKVPTGFTYYTPGAGEPKTLLGKLSYHERPIRITAVDANKKFWVLVKGRSQALLTSVAVRRSPSFCAVKSFAVLGLGLDLPEGCVSTCGNFNPKQAVKNLQIVAWEGCIIEKHFSATTGAFLGLSVSPTTPECSVDVGDVNDPDNPPQPVTGLMLGTEQVTFGDGDATTGDASCFNTFVGGVYARVCR